MITMPAEGCHEGFLTKKCFPFITGFVLVAGFGMFGAGVGVMNREIAHAAISSVPIQDGPIVLLVAGILSLVVAGLGFYNICIKRNQTLDDMNKSLIVFIVLLAMVAVLAFTAGVVGLVHIKKLNAEFETDLKTEVEMYAKSGYERMANIDRLQKKDQCCGASYYTDWRATVYGGHRYDKVPDSCCKTDHDEYGCGFKFKDDATINRMGCASIAVGKMKESLMVIGCMGIVLGLIEAILCISFLYLYCHHEGSQGEDRTNIKIEYRKSDTPPCDESGHEQIEHGGDAPTSEGGAAPTAQGAAAPTAQGGVAPTAQGGDTSGVKVKGHHRTAKTSPETSKTKGAHDVHL